MNDYINEISSTDIIVNILFCLLFLSLTAFFMNTHKKYFGTASLWTGLSGSYVFIFLGLTTCLVVSVIQSSIALSLGLVGALSIIRFRTPIKSPEDLAKLFFSISIGIGCASGKIAPTAIFILIIIVFDVAFRFIRQRAVSIDTNEYEIFISLEDSKHIDETINLINKESNNNCRISRIDNRDNAANIWIHSSLNEEAVINVQDNLESNQSIYKVFSIQSIS